MIDDITDFNRLAQLFTIYQSAGKRLQTATMGFGIKEDMFKTAGDGQNAVTPQLFRSEEHFSKPIPPKRQQKDCDEIGFVFLPESGPLDSPLGAVGRN